jgi:Niemann-Pick C1 protein
VQDELTRESYTDASVVAISYVVMLGYIALALASLPPARQVLQLFVLSRAGLGLGGVLIVAASVAGALGLCSWFGMWSTLIIMEVIPFLVLAVGVDNMFVLAHTLGRQVRRGRIHICIKDAGWQGVMRGKTHLHAQHCGLIILQVRGWKECQI